MLKEEFTAQEAARGACQAPLDLAKAKNRSILARPAETNDMAMANPTIVSHAGAAWFRHVQGLLGL